MRGRYWLVFLWVLYIPLLLWLAHAFEVFDTGFSFLEADRVIELIVLGILVSVTGWYAWWTGRMARQGERDQEVRLRPWLTLKDGLIPDVIAEVARKGPNVCLQLELRMENVGLLPAKNVHAFGSLLLCASEVKTLSKDVTWEFLKQHKDPQGRAGSIFHGGHMVVCTEMVKDLPLNDDEEYKARAVIHIKYEGPEGRPYWTLDRRFITIEPHSLGLTPQKILATVDWADFDDPFRK